MLVVTRKPGESIVIGDRIIVKIVSVSGDQVRVAIEAPRDITILRAELLEKVAQENKEAASTNSMLQFYQNFQNLINLKPKSVRKISK